MENKGTVTLDIFLNYSYVSSYYKQKLLHEIEIVQLLHDYKFYGVEQRHFRKLFFILYQKITVK